MGGEDSVPHLFPSLSISALGLIWDRVRVQFLRTVLAWTFQIPAPAWVSCEVYNRSPIRQAVTTALVVPCPSFPPDLCCSLVPQRTVERHCGGDRQRKVGVRSSIVGPFNPVSSFLPPVVPVRRGKRRQTEMANTIIQHQKIHRTMRQLHTSKCCTLSNRIGSCYPKRKENKTNTCLGIPSLETLLSLSPPLTPLPVVS